MADGSISFNSIPLDLDVPGTFIEIDNSKAFNGVMLLPTKILVIGQRLAAGIAPAGRADLITSKDQAAAYYGAASQLAHMLAALIKVNPYTETWAIGIDDNAAGAAASGTLTFTGTATAAGTLALMIGGVRLQVGVALGDTAAQVATKVVATVTAAATLDVTAAAAAGVVTLTARHKGEVGNYIDLRHSYYTGEALPAGITLAIAAMSGGTGNPVIQPVLDQIGDTWFTDFIIPYTDAANLTAIEQKLGDDFGPLKMIDGHCWTGAAGSLASLTTLAAGRNSPHLTIVGMDGLPTTPWEYAAAYGATGAYYLSIDPARPLQELPLAGILAPQKADRFTLQENQILLTNRIATSIVDAGNNVVMQRAVTTYKTNPFGAADPSYMDVETMRTLATLRYDLRNYMTLQFPRYKLADDGTNYDPGQAIVTPSVIRASIISRFYTWEKQGLVEHVDQFKEDLIVVRDTNKRNRVNALIPPDIINQFRQLFGQMQFRL